MKQRLICGMLIFGLSHCLAGCLDSSSDSADRDEPSAPASRPAAPVKQDEDECTIDDDGDGYCAESWGATSRLDCDDSDARRHPGAKELLNAIDDNCNTSIDEGLATDCPLTLEEPEGGCETALTLVAGADGTCVLTTSGRVLCWGSHIFGTPDVTTSPVPIAVPGIAGATALVGAYDTPICALVDSDAICWGAGAAYPIRVPLPEATVQIAVTARPEGVAGRGMGSIFALDELGRSYSRSLWPVDGASTTFTTRRSGIAQLVGGNALMCSITTDRVLQCEDGDADPAVIAGGVTLAAAGFERICYLSAGELYCGAPTGPGKVVAGNGSAVGFSSRYNAGCAFNSEGKLACWEGAGPQGVDDAYGVAMGEDFGCILHLTGRVSCWGEADGGQLGDGTTRPRLEPEPVGVYPGPQHDLKDIVLGGESPLGACDQFADAAILRDRHVGVHTALSNCKTECVDRLDAADCFATCATNPGLGADCFDCYVSLASCEGADCYAEFQDCAGYPVDFLGVLDYTPRFECTGAGCLRGASVGQACGDNADCASGACVTLPHAPDLTVCGASDGMSCSERSPYCECRLGDVSGFCGSCDAEGRTGSLAGDCYRECTSTSYCTTGQTCRYFSNNNQRYCEY